MCMASYYDEVDKILQAHYDLRRARKALEASSEMLNVRGTKLIKAKVQLPKDWHDDRPSGWSETDENAGRSTSQIQAGIRIEKEEPR